VANVLGIYRVEITFTQTKIMDGIQQVGLANTIVTHKTIYPWRK
jgi:hypothetical protein